MIPDPCTSLLIISLPQPRKIVYLQLLPPQLAEEFGDFFLNKILKIHQLFEGAPTLDLQISESVPKFCSFAPMSESDVKSIIMGMKTKSCELDPLPTHILKQLIDKLISTITFIVNQSLCQGKFSQSWKYATVRPLLKKPGLELNYKNY